MQKVLHPKQLEFLELSAHLGKLFSLDNIYLIGGTSLALQIEHRASIDFDFATATDMNIDKYIAELNSVPGKFNITQVEQNTLTIDWQTVKISFFGGINLKLLKPHLAYKHLKLLSIDDISAMKLRTMLSRATLKDYFDLAYLIKYQGISLNQIIKNFYEKYQDSGKQFGEELLVKTLMFTTDLESTPIKILNHNEFWGETREEIIKNINEVIAQAVDKLISDKLK